MHYVTLTNIPVKPIFTQLKDTQAIMQTSPKNSNMTNTQKPHLQMFLIETMFQNKFHINFT